MCRESHKRSILLHSLDSREQLLFRESHLSLPPGSCLVTPFHRDEQAAWIVSSCAELGFGVDTVSLAIAIFDRVLLETRVLIKYVNCVATTCLYLAVKLCEECLTYVSDVNLLTFRLNRSYSTSELSRMELAILKCLNWDLCLPNVHRFAAAMVNGAIYRLLPIRSALEMLLCSSNLTFKYRPSVLALALLSLLLEHKTQFWLVFTVEYQRYLQINEGELIACREDIASVIGLKDKENCHSNCIFGMKIPCAISMNSHRPKYAFIKKTRWASQLSLDSDLFSAEPLWD